MFSFFNHELLRRYTVAFGSFFDKIQIRRFDNSATEIQRLVVPIDYGPKERWLVRLKEDPDLKKSVAQVVPRMAYELTNISYDGARKLVTLNKMNFPFSTPERRLSQIYVGVPYNLTFELAILTKTQSDGLQIVEQILPYFTPDLTFKMLTIPELALTDTIPMTISSVQHSDNYEGTFETRRVVMWTLTFSMKAWMYGPTRTGKPITEVIVDIYNAGGNLLDPPEILATETFDEFVSEDGTGHLVDESTSNTYLSTGRVARIDAALTPKDQDPSPNPSVLTTIEETSQDIKRNLTLADENV
jgi:hypothetical protein